MRRRTRIWISLRVRPQIPIQNTNSYVCSTSAEHNSQQGGAAAETCAYALTPGTTRRIRFPRS